MYFVLNTFFDSHFGICTYVVQNSFSHCDLLKLGHIVQVTLFNLNIFWGVFLETRPDQPMIDSGESKKALFC